MPFIAMKTLAGAWTDEQRNRLIEEITEAVVRVGGEGIRPNVLVVIEEIRDGGWGAGGKNLTLAALEARRAARATKAES